MTPDPDYMGGLECPDVKRHGRVKRADDKRLRHGLRRHSLYKTWLDMWARCVRNNNAAFCAYGGRGITVCDRWKSFPVFLSDMGPRPEGMTLDRIDNNGPYSPENCRWATHKQQSSNRRSNHFVEWSGETITLTEAARRAGMDHRTFARRLRRGVL